MHKTNNAILISVPARNMHESYRSDLKLGHLCHESVKLRFELSQLDIICMGFSRMVHWWHIQLIDYMTCEMIGSKELD